MADLESTVTLGNFFALEFQDLQKTAELRSYAAGDVIFSQGERGDGFFYVEQGEVEISANVGDDDRRVFARVGPGEIFGEMAVLDDGPRSATATAGGNAKAYFIGREELFQILKTNPETMFRLLRYFSQRIRTTNQQYIDEALQAEKLAVIGRFARTIVHDFKNPLNVIGLATEMIGMQADSATARQNSVERIERQVKRMSNMLTELLEFRRGDSQAVVFSSHNYAAFVNDLIADVQLDADEKNVQLSLKNDPPDVNLPVDPPRLTHLLLNLIHNAMDAMPGGGKITISFEESAERVVTHIQDSGPGIAAEISTKLFEPFATHGKSHGTGLGLSICKKITDDHGGQIWVNSFPGDGARFSFSIPKSQVA